MSKEIQRKKNYSIESNFKKLFQSFNRYDETIHDRNGNYQRNDLFCNSNFSDIYNTQEIMMLNYLSLLGP